MDDQQKFAALLGKLSSLERLDQDASDRFSAESTNVALSESGAT